MTASGCGGQQMPPNHRDVYTYSIESQLAPREMREKHETLDMRMLLEPCVTNVRIRNFKSIGACAVRLGRLTILVGRNSSGKSNFLDALRFVTDSLQTSLDHAIKSRGGIEAVRRRSTGHPHNFSIELQLNVSESEVARYSFEIGAESRGGFSVKREALQITRADGSPGPRYIVEAGNVTHPADSTMPKAVSDRLYLVTASGLPEYRAAYDALTAMGFYNLNPEAMKEVQNPDAGQILRRDGSNLASVIARITDDQPDVRIRMTEYLQAIVPDIVGFERVALGHHETLQFRQEVKGAKQPWRFYAASMSDGTLRALGILVAVMQLADRKRNVRVIGIEEPETALHPAATGALMDCLRGATEHTQVLITTHSPDLLDQFDAQTDDLLVVMSNQGTTEIGPADRASLESISKHLYTAGELLRMDQLQPDTASTEYQNTMNWPETTEP